MLRIFLVLGLVSASVAQYKFDLPHNAHEIVKEKIALGHLKAGSLSGHRGPVRRSALDVDITDALSIAKPVNNNNEAVLPLFGPNLTAVAVENDVTYCEITTVLDFCDGEFADLFKVLCPISCEQPEDEFCVQNDAQAAFYVEQGLKLDMDTSSCAAMVASYGKTQIFHSDNQLYLFCEHPGLGIMCAEVCKINCWYWPPPPTMKVFLPDCKDTVAIPIDYYPATLQNRATPATADQYSGICPPANY